MPELSGIIRINRANSPVNKLLYPQFLKQLMNDKESTDLKKALEMLTQASKLVDGSLQISPRNAEGFDYGNQVKMSGHILHILFEMESNIWDLDPDLVPEDLRPNLHPIDLANYIEDLQAEHELPQRHGIRVMQLYMPKDVLAQFEKIDNLKDKYDFAMAWWNDQEKPFIPIHRIARFLKHERLNSRYHAAQLIEKQYNVVLWDKEKNALDDEAVNNWLQMENINI